MGKGTGWRFLFPSPMGAFHLWFGITGRVLMWKMRKRGWGWRACGSGWSFRAGTLCSNQPGVLGQPFEPHGHCLKILKSAVLISSSRAEFTFWFGRKVGDMLRILIVEDNQIFREAFKTVIQDRLPSLVIEEAGTGEEALQRIKEAPPDLIFVDMRLGGMDGLPSPKK